ncbi:MAG TPA: AAA family ATPase [Pirellulaceae bacterium]|jgi:type II secretory pathway predicted ATPase ExeA|nr:AAA family ATPase [Pirellulaceae bacterium]
MYEALFRLSSRPFSPYPRTDRFFPSAEIEQARACALRSISRGEGVTVVIGPPGTGKTLLCRMIEEAFAGDFRIVSLQGVRLATRKALLQSLLFGLGMPHRGGEENDFRLSVLESANDEKASPRGLLVVIDEADLLPLRVLEELRLLANVVKGGEPRIRLVLAGGPSLDEKLSHPRMEAFQQRLGMRRYLHPWNREETRNYVQSQWRRVGGSPEAVFDEKAYAAIYHATAGFPRAVNQLCDHALILAAEAGATKIDANRIEMAWADLQQLPLPTKEPATFAGRSGIVEFGALADEPSRSMTAYAPAPEVEEVDDVEPGVFDFGFESNSFRDSETWLAVPRVDEEADAHEEPAGWDPFAEAFDEEALVEDRVSRIAPPATASFEARSASPASVRKEPARTAPAIRETVKPEPPARDDRARTIRVEPAARDRDDRENSLEQDLLDATLQISPARFAPTDDRDLILVEEDVREEAPRSDSGAVVDSRQLFARLRQTH